MLRGLRHVAAAVLAVALGTGLAASSVEPPEKAGRIEQVYDLYAGGIWVGEMLIRADVGAGDYKADAELRTAGIVRTLFDASFEARTQGEIAGGAMRPERFVATSRDRDDVQAVTIDYQGGNPASVLAEPPFREKSYGIDPLQQRGVPDPITGLLGVVAPRADGFCDRRIEVFDGQRRYAVVIGKPEPSGDRIRCPAKYQRVAGFKAKMMGDRAEREFDMWFEKGADGLYRPARLLLRTDLANLSLVRRD